MKVLIAAATLLLAPCLCLDVGHQPGDIHPAPVEETHSNTSTPRPLQQQKVGHGLGPVGVPVSPREIQAGHSGPHGHSIQQSGNQYGQPAPYWQEAEPMQVVNYLEYGAEDVAPLFLVMSGEGRPQLGQRYTIGQEYLRTMYPASQEYVQASYPGRQEYARTSYPASQEYARSSYPKEQEYARSAYPREQQYARSVYPTEQQYARSVYPREQQEYGQESPRFEPSGYDSYGSGV